jgi:hypothetical protein
LDKFFPIICKLLIAIKEKNIIIKLIRKKRYYKSKLEPKKSKLLLMHSKGASIAEIAIKEKNIIISLN